MKLRMAKYVKGILLSTILGIFEPSIGYKRANERATHAAPENQPGGPSDRP